MKSLLKLSSLLFFMAIIASCALNQEYQPVNYYIMDYDSYSEKPALKQQVTFPSTLQINEAVIPHTYNRNQIVVKNSLYRVTYLQNDQWSSKLYETITNLVQERMVNYNIFSRADQEFANEKPTYEMDIVIRNIERLDYGERERAHLALDFNLRKGGNEDIIFTHHGDVEQDLWDLTLDSFVIQINDILMQQTDMFAGKVIAYLKTGEKPAIQVTNIPARTDSLSKYMTMITGETQGELYLPALSDPDTEPLYIVYDSDENEIATGRMGVPLSISKGNYTVRYGSELLMSKDVSINPNTRLTINPDWGAMIVNIIDENRNPVKISYEVFNDVKNDVISYGTDYSRIEELGEKPISWILPPGQYKITLNGQTYNTYTDFTTVTITPDIVYRLSIVVDANNHMVGAGMIRAEDVLATAKGLKFSNSVNGIINLTSNNSNQKIPEQTFSLSGQFDNRATYDIYPHHYTTKSLYEIELTSFSKSDIRVTIDEYSIRNTYIYYFTKPLGIYTRADAASHFFPGRIHYDSPSNVIKINNSGVADTLFKVDSAQISPSLLPLNLREGIGINYRMFQSLKANVNLRSGFGLQQIFNKDVYNFANKTYAQHTSQGDSLTFDQYKEIISTYPKGIEASIISSFIISFLNMGITSTADFLFPFQKGQDPTMDIENILTISLIRNVSLDIRVNLHYDKASQPYLIQDYRTYLRVSWFY